MNEDIDWIDEERLLGMVYIRRGYSEVVALDMAQREIEKRKIQAVRPFKTKEGELGNKTRRTWPLLFLHFEELLVCSKCGKRLNTELVHLGLCDDKIDEVLCAVCWRTMPEWRKKE
jgi:hypothetical protein